MNQDLSTPKESQKRETQTGDPLSGTFVSVMILGGIIAVSWVAILILFIQRGG